MNVKWELWRVDNAQRSIATQSDILYETVKEGLWGISSQGTRSETCDSVNFSLSLSTLRATEVAQRSGSKLGGQRRLCEELQGELMSIDTHSHTVFCLPRPQLHRRKTTRANEAMGPRLTIIFTVD